MAPPPPPGTRHDSTNRQDPGAGDGAAGSSRVRFGPRRQEIRPDAAGDADAIGAEGLGSSRTSDMTIEPLPNDDMRRLARERLAALRTSSQQGSPAPAEPRRLGPGWMHEAPAGLRELHIELSALQILRRGKSSVKMGWPADSPPGSAQREFEAAADDETRAARSLLSAASGWLEVDQMLDLVVLAAAEMGWSHVPARELFFELLARPGPGPGGDEPGPQRPVEPK